MMPFWVPLFLIGFCAYVIVGGCVMLLAEEDDGTPLDYSLAQIPLIAVRLMFWRWLGWPLYVLSRIARGRKAFPW